MKKSLAFKPRARLLLQLGDQLIRNDSIALLELVKNSYDACAKEVKVTMDKLEDMENGSIVIQDDGLGMDLWIIENVWMEPGTDYKKVADTNSELFKKCKRWPLGEKGIGRFGAHKMGSEIELISKMKNRKEVYLKINWGRFSDSRYLEDVLVDIYEREEPEFFTRGSGTKIIIRDLRNKWTRGMVREVFRSMNALCSPFNAPDSFKVQFKIDKDEWIKDLKTWEEIKDECLFKVSCDIEGQQISRFKYEFTPWPTMTRLIPRTVTEKHPDVMKRRKIIPFGKKDEKKAKIDLSKFKIGKVHFEAYIFDMDKKILKLGVQDSRGLTEYLDFNGGIRVYRDLIRVYDYGEPNNDWLDLGGRRVNLPTRRLSNNLIVGAVHIDRDASADLVEKTNREGFIENDVYHEFREAVLYAIFVLEFFRGQDKEKIRKFYGPTPSSEPVISSINDLKKVVDQKIKDKPLKDEVHRMLRRIESEYKSINEILLKSASLGLNLSVVIHEIEKIVAELKKVIKKEKIPGRIKKLIKHLSSIIDSYGDLVRKSHVANENLMEIIDQALINVELRLNAHKIKVIKDEKSINELAHVKCKRNLVIGSIMNIIDNSIWWLNYSDIKKKKIFISISDEIPGYICTIIADNGPGFTLPTDEIAKPFVTAKPDGMGLGLHIVNEVMQMQGGKLLFPEEGDFVIPEEFKKGAVAVLMFKMEIKK